MAILTFKSPGVSTREIDLSGPTTVQPTGVPAGIIGTALRGPAFVPITVATFTDFINKFGNTDGKKFGPLAMDEWMRNATAGTYVRLLGVGDGKQRVTAGLNKGKVNNAGFVVGDSQVQANGIKGANPYATAGGPPGRAYVLGHYAKDTAGSTLLADTGAPTHLGATPVVRGIILAASGVKPTLNSVIHSHADNLPNLAVATAKGTSYGDVATGSAKQEFILILNGHKGNALGTDTLTSLTASFDPSAPNYFRKQWKWGPEECEKNGFCLYNSYDLYQTQAVITGSGITGHDDDTNLRKVQAAFLLESQAAHNSGSVGTASNVGMVNLEGFEDRFQTARSPFVVSQKFGGKNKNIFKIHALDDGRAGSDTFKITILNIKASTNENNPYGTFSLYVRFFADADKPGIDYAESFHNLDLNPGSENYIARRIGDMHTFYDFDKATGGQKIVIEGNYPNVSNFIRVEMHPDVSNDAINDTALPMGFRGIDHLVTSGTINSKPIFSGSSNGLAVLGAFAAANTPVNDEVARLIQLPVPFRENLGTGTRPELVVSPNLTWGVQFEKKDSVTEPNKNDTLEESVRSHVVYMPSYHTEFQNPLVGGNEGTPDVGGTVLDADRFNNNFFSLERIEVIKTTDEFIDSTQWAAATYRRNGGAAGTLTDIDGNAGIASRLIDPSKDFTDLTNMQYLKFTFPLQGGFDGVNIFDNDKATFADAALRREMDDAGNQGGASGPTVTAYRKAILVMEEKTDVDIQLLATPGARHESVTDFAIDSVERRFDALYILDCEEMDTFNSPITGSSQRINVRNTVNRHAGRAFDSSFGAAYFPDVIVQDPAAQVNVKCPPSVAVLGALSFNDSIAHPWFAPAGFNRGALARVLYPNVNLNRGDLDELYDADINPITKFPTNDSVVIFGQKTLLAGQSALDRVNVRRLLIDVRRQVKVIANSLLFEPNRSATLAKFSNAVTPILSRIQQQQGLDRFKVQIDASTTTQADVENNTIRGKIFLQPTRSLEFVSLDFMITNAGNAFEQA